MRLRSGLQVMRQWERDYDRSSGFQSGLRPPSEAENGNAHQPQLEVHSCRFSKPSTNRTRSNVSVEGLERNVGKLKMNQISSSQQPISTRKTFMTLCSVRENDEEELKIKKAKRRVSTLPKLRIVLTKEEIQEDWIKMNGRKPRRSSKLPKGLELCQSLVHPHTITYLHGIRAMEGMTLSQDFNLTLIHGRHVKLEVDCGGGIAQGDSESDK